MKFFQTSGLFALAIVAFVFYSEGLAASEQVFDDRQVAEIRVSVDPQALDWMLQWENRYSDSLHLCKVHFVNATLDETIDSVGIRLRGNTSRDAQKKSFKLSFNTFIKGRRFNGLDKLNVNGEHNDPSISRSKLCWDMFQTIGMPASHAAHAALYIDDTYFGLYVLVEHVDEEFLKPRFVDPSGNLWKCLWPADLTYRGDQVSDYYPYQDATRPYELKTNTEAYDYSKLARMIIALNQTSALTLEDSLEALLDVPEVLRYFALNILFGSWDDYWATMNNYYLYHEPAVDRLHWIPYDYDNTLGVDWSGTDWSQVSPYTFGRVSDGPRPLAERLMADNRYRDLYTHFLEFFLQEIMQTTDWSARLDSLKSKLLPWVSGDPYYPLDYGFNLDDFDNSFDGAGYQNNHVKYSILDFIDRRMQSLQSQLSYRQGGPIIYDLQTLNETDSILVSASAFSAAGVENLIVEISEAPDMAGKKYTMRFNPAPGTKKVELADRWQVRIPVPQPGTSAFLRVQVTDAREASRLYPRRGPLQLKSPALLPEGVVINEFLARNSSVNSDEYGEYDDWVELYNPTNQDIELQGMYLSDHSDQPLRWRFAEPTMLDAGTFLLVWCDGDTAQGPLHSSFKLSGNGESIILTDADGLTTLDRYDFGAQSQDISMGRNPDGSGNFEFMMPTPAAANKPTAIEDRQTTPQDWELTAWPNPFNGVVTFSWHQPRSGLARLQLFNALGQKVWSHLSPNLSAGPQRLRLDGVALPGSGVYFYRLQSLGISNTGKILYLK